MQISLIGIYPIDAPEPCHLLELQISDALGEIDLSEVTQPVQDQPRENWQVPFDEVWLTPSGDAEVSGAFCQPRGRELRLAFYFHHLSTSAPLLTPCGPIDIPPETAKPSRLSFLQYDAP